MEATSPASESTVVGEAGARTRFLGRARLRPRPSFADALSAGGGALVWIGALLVAADVFADSNDGWKGALFFAGLGTLGLVLLRAAPAPLHPGCMTALVLSVPAAFGFLIFPSAEGFGDIRIFLALTIGTWLLLFMVSDSRGRPILVALVATALYLWALGEVADTDAYFAAPVPSPPHSTPAALVDAMSGGEPAADATFGSFAAQQVTLEDLDSSDPLYPLAEDCAAGDLVACDDLWSESEVGSDFETFAESCGGDPVETWPCAGSDDGGLDDPFDEDLSIVEDPFDANPIGDRPDTLEIGIVSLLFGAVYLATVYLLDRRRLDALGTAFVLPATGALLTAAAALGAETESAVFGGLLTIAFGFAIGVVGFVDARRFTAWAGGAIASVGALVIAADVAPESSGDDVDLIGPGLVVLAFGLAVVGLSWFVNLLLERRPPHDTPDGASPTASPPASPAAAGTDAADEIQPADSVWVPPSSPPSRPPSGPPSGPWSGPSSP